MTSIKFGTGVSPLSGAHAQSFGVSEALASTAETPLGYTGIEVAGPDAGTFLQGQMTNDITTLAAGQCHLSALCEPKGRVIAQMDIVRTDVETFALILAHHLAPAVLATLSKYIMRSKVSIKPWPDHTFFSLRRTGEAPARGDCRTNADQTLVCRPTWLPSSDPDWVLSNAPGDTDNDTKERDLTWAHAHVLLGLAPPVTATDLQHIPQMLNLDALEGVSMTKGCYTGQEIIARVHHRGSVKRRLRRFIADATNDIVPGSTVENSDGGNAGSVVEVARDDHDQLGVLAVIKESDYSPEKALSCNSAELKHWALPYPV